MTPAWFIGKNSLKLHITCITDPFWNITCSIFHNLPTCWKRSCLIIDGCRMLSLWGPMGDHLFSVGELAGLAAIASWSHASPHPSLVTMENGIWPPLTPLHGNYMGYVCSPVLTIHYIPSPSSAPNPCVQSLAYIHRVSCDVTHRGKIDVLQISKNQLLSTVNNVFHQTMGLDRPMGSAKSLPPG